MPHLPQVGLYEAQREATDAELGMLRKELAAVHAELRDKDNLIMRKDRAGGWKTLEVGVLLEKQMAAEKAASEKVRAGRRVYPLLILPRLWGTLFRKPDQLRIGSFSTGSNHGDPSHSQTRRLFLETSNFDVRSNLLCFPPVALHLGWRVSSMVLNDLQGRYSLSYQDLLTFASRICKPPILHFPIWVPGPRTGGTGGFARGEAAGRQPARGGGGEAGGSAGGGERQPAAGAGGAAVGARLPGDAAPARAAHPQDRGERSQGTCRVNETA